MKRAGFFALCALGVAATAVYLQGLRARTGPPAAPQGTALAPRSSAHESPRHDAEPLAVIALDEPRVEVSPEFDRTPVRDGSGPEADRRARADHVPLRLVAGGTSVSSAGSSIDCVAFNVEPVDILDDAVELVRVGGGELWLARHTLEALVSGADPARPLHLALLDRGRSRERIGFVGGPFDGSVTELLLEEAPAARVQLRAERRVTSRFLLSVTALLLEPSAEDPRLGLIAHPLGLAFEWGSLEFGPEVASFPCALIPGRWSLSFDLPRSPLLQIAPVVVDLVPGQQEVTIVVPELFEVTVHAPSLGVGERLQLCASSAAAKAATGRKVRDFGALDAGRRVTFIGLPAGPYVLTHGASHAPENIVVPCGEVLYEPRRSDAFEVRLAPLDGGGQGALARAGFKSGDVVLDFNGRGLREHDDLEALLAVIAESEASVHVRRGAHTLELRLGPMPDPGDPWATFDADFLPAWR